MPVLDEGFRPINVGIIEIKRSEFAIRYGRKKRMTNPRDLCTIRLFFRLVANHL
jgi:hypothetical protein